MKKISRRHFGKIVSSLGVASAFGMPSLVLGASRKVVVIGGGFGGGSKKLVIPALRFGSAPNRKQHYAMDGEAQNLRFWRYVISG